MRIFWFFSNLFWLPSASFWVFFKAILTGVYFDLPVLAYFYLPSWFWLLLFPKLSKKQTLITRLLFTVSSAACIILNGIDMAYSRLTSKRTGFEIVNLIKDEGNKITPYIEDYIWAIIGIIIVLYFVFKITPCKGDNLYLYNKDKKWHTLIVLPIFSGIWILCARGGTHLKPLRSLDAGEYTIAGLGPLVSSTPLQFMSTLGQKPMREFHFMPMAEAEAILGITKMKENEPAPDKKNVVLIIVESLGRDYTGFLNNQPFTPFLDSLSAKSLNFRFCYANGTKSIEMVPAIFCGLPGIGEEHYINSIYSTNNTKNLFAVFDKLGYSTSFYHGGVNGTMGFQAFLEYSGLKQYFGLNEYPDKEKDHDGNWGIYDEPYLQYLVSEINKMKKPFFTSVFTLSSHHPYKIPEKYTLSLPDGKLPIHRSIAYADLSLRHFFESAAKTNWYENTIFVITGDHTSYGTLDYFYSQTGHYEIPMLIFSPAYEPRVIDKSMSQCDIGPTILDLLKIRTNWFSLGRSALDSNYEGYAFHYDEGAWYIVQYPYVLGIDAYGNVRDYSKRMRNEKRATPLAQTGDKFNELDRYLKAYLQVYSNRILHNRWFSE